MNKCNSFHICWWWHRGDLLSLLRLFGVLFHLSHVLEVTQRWFIVTFKVVCCPSPPITCVEGDTEVIYQGWCPFTFHLISRGVKYKRNHLRYTCSNTFELFLKYLKDYTKISEDYPPTFIKVRHAIDWIISY